MVWSPCSLRDSQESSPTPQFKNINSSALSFMVQLSHPYMTTGKTIALTRWTFAGKGTSLLCNMLSRCVIAFLLRNKCLLFSWLQSQSAVIFRSDQIRSVAQSCPTLCDPMNHSTPGLPVQPKFWSSLRLTSIESVMPPSHLILCRPLLLLPPIPPSMSLFQWVNSLHEVAKVLEFQL